ncbi:hypothetical protein IW140_001265 [Coemansia sp. RSA 1813]|nr:hypothetical protein EV178_001145 [Coemansia sp. RSA 1646]KAJ1771750.1 hypothetical protein LPJ74_002052 [Coemansia sp. RSA 1843]KAJ2091685.1 hypothetical protein IW138_001668 [Coemansia sp. RSA 986]KAJ2216913.1 hypothetical protein EV179_000947 [Coemansia sp. RSA 487]KAJ2571916.1 hypothetical protein IW140_001265 [Coemansia sp. RSA 1813]
MKKPTQSALLRQTQYLQTVAVEASNQLRSQSISMMQTQAIRLEDMADTEMEDTAHIDKCMSELMHIVLFTELRKEIREISDSLDGMQFRLVCSRGRPTRAASKQTVLPNSGGAQDNDDESEAPETSDTDDLMPRPLSPSETFRTARGVPFPEPIESGNSENGDNINGGDHNINSDDGQPGVTNNGEQDEDEPEDVEKTLDELEHRLYGTCIEVLEWRRTHYINDFITSMETKNTGLRRVSRPPSILSFSSIRHPVERIIGEVRERERKKRTSSLGNAAANGLSCSLPADAFDPPQFALGSTSLVSPPPPMPPLSRLLEVEREIETTRLSPQQRRRSSNESRTSAHIVSPSNNNSNHDGVISPSGRSLGTRQDGNLRLIGFPTATTPHRASISDERRSSREIPPPQRRSHPQTFVDDVRIIGWVTRGRGLDVHTEFKVVVHLTRGENLTVMRRYTDFEILREVVCERYRTFRKRVPHLPQKKAFGKFEDSFLKKRESGLQFFLAYVMLHPVIGCSTVIRQWIEGVP